METASWPSSFFAICCVGWISIYDARGQDVELRAPVPVELRAPVPDDVELGLPLVQENENAALDQVFYTPPHSASAIIPYNTLIALIEVGDVESISIDTVLAIAMVHPKPNSDFVKTDRLVSLPYWSFRGSPDYFLRELCETHGVKLYIIDENTRFSFEVSKPLYRRPGTWSMVLSLFNLVVLVFLFFHVAKLKNPCQTAEQGEDDQATAAPKSKP